MKEHLKNKSGFTQAPSMMDISRNQRTGSNRVRRCLFRENQKLFRCKSTSTFLPICKSLYNYVLIYRYLFTALLLFGLHVNALSLQCIPTERYNKERKNPGI